MPGDTCEPTVVVIGAGPAGLFTALGLSSPNTHMRVVVMDSGTDVDDRYHEHQRHDSGKALTEGVGGAGLFSDGKLCLSLDIGGEIGLVTTPQTRARLLRCVATAFGVADLLEDQDAGLDSTELRRAGIQITRYPVHHIGTENCGAVIAHLRNSILERGVRLLPETRLLSLRKLQSGRFELTTEHRERTAVTLADRVVLAMGKVGSQHAEQLCRTLGVRVSDVPMYLGLRLETDSQHLDSLFLDTHDPKLKLHFADGSKIKTHCGANGGGILPLPYAGITLAGGHADRRPTSGRSSIALLWDGATTGGLRSKQHVLGELTTRATEFARQGLMVQRLEDLLHDRASSPEDVMQCGPTTRAWTAGDLRNLLPAEYFPPLKALLDALQVLAPKVNSSSTLLYGPAVEWWMNRISTSSYLETSCPGLFVAGDGSGWSQGIVHAAATGLLASEGILHAETFPDDLVLV